LALDQDCTDARVSGRLVHYVLAAENNFHEGKAVFASIIVKRRVAARFYLRERLSFAATIDKMKFDSSFGGTRGVLSELVWHHQLREGGNFRIKSLTPTSALSKDVTVPKFEGDVVTCEYDMRDLVALNDEEYVSPIFPAVDAFMVTKTPFFDPDNSNGDEFLIGLQMASSKKREYSLKGSQVINWISKVKGVRFTINCNEGRHHICREHRRLGPMVCSEV
jgi:hypothetical protein